MTIEIISAEISSAGLVRVTGIDCSEMNLQRIERNRDDGGFEQEIDFVFDTTDVDTFTYLRKWLKSQKATRNSRTYGEALRAVVGTVTTIQRKYRTWD